MDNSQNSNLTAQHVKKIQLLRESVEREWRGKFGKPKTANMVSDPQDITSIVTWMLAEAIPEAELFMLLLDFFPLMLFFFTFTSFSNTISGEEDFSLLTP